MTKRERVEATQTWYRVSRGDDSIEPVEVVSETEKTLVVPDWSGTTRTPKRSRYVEHFPTWEEARDELLARAESLAGSARYNRDTAQQRAELALSKAEARVEKIKRLTPPEREE